MANICSFSMRVKGSKDSVEKFVNALEQNGSVCIGRGANMHFVSENGNYTSFAGDTKWSMYSSLIENAVSMRKQKENDNVGMWEATFIENHDFLTIFEMAKNLNIEFEAISEEPGCCFQEHLAYINGETIDETEDGFECLCFDPSKYNSKEECEQDYEISLTEKEFAEGYHRKETSIGEKGFVYIL